VPTTGTNNVSIFTIGNILPLDLPHPIFGLFQKWKVLSMASLFEHGTIQTSKADEQHRRRGDTQMATKAIRINVNTPPATEKKLSSMFSAIVYSLESYFGPMNVEVMDPEKRARLSVEDKANVDTTLNGVGTF
jgi:hypothetical protein